MVPRRDPAARERLAALAPRIDSGPLSAERTIPVAPSLVALLPTGLTRGNTVGCRGVAAHTIAFSVASGGSQAGMWTAVAGMPELGVSACAEAGVDLSRLVAVREPATPFGDEQWGQILAALIDGFDFVVFGAAGRIRPATARRLQSRLQSRGAVMVIVGQPGSFSCDLRVAGESTWIGLGEGHGHLRTRRLDLAVDGRRIPRTRRATVWFPTTDSAVVPDTETPSVAPALAPAVVEPAAAVALGRTG